MTISRDIEMVLERFKVGEPYCIATNTECMPGQRIKINEGPTHLKEIRHFIIKWVAGQRLPSGELVLREIMDDGTIADIVLGHGSLGDFFPRSDTDGKSYLFHPQPYTFLS